MIDFVSLIKNTAAYGVFSGEKKQDRIAHAYLIVHADGENLLSYLKIFAKTVLIGDETDCRAADLIEKGIHPDVKIYPAGEKDAVLTEDIVDLIGESYIKPIESEKKIFIINRAETMSAAAQNKLLKTLEEPPKNIVILLGATSEYPLLLTVKSRVRKLVISEFDSGALLSALKKECPDIGRLKTAIACGDGTVGKALKNYRDEKLPHILDCACDIITDMKSSKDVLFYSRKIAELKTSAAEILAIFKAVLRDMLYAAEKKEELAANKDVLLRVKNAEGYSVGAIIFALDKISEAEKRLKFNASEEIVIERVLFQILEGKYKWRKL